MIGDRVLVKCEKCGCVVSVGPNNITLKMYLHVLECPKCHEKGSWSYSTTGVVTK